MRLRDGVWVIGTPEDTLVVARPDVARGPPAANLCRSYLLLLAAAPDLAPASPARSRAAKGLARRDELALLPVLAGARLADGVAGETARLRALIAAAGEPMD